MRDHWGEGWGWEGLGYGDDDEWRKDEWRGTRGER